MDETRADGGSFSNKPSCNYWLRFLSWGVDDMNWWKYHRTCFDGLQCHGGLPCGDDRGRVPCLPMTVMLYYATWDEVYVRRSEAKWNDWWWNDVCVFVLNDRYVDLYWNEWPKSCSGHRDESDNWRTTCLRLFSDCAHHRRLTSRDFISSDVGSSSERWWQTSS